MFVLKEISFDNENLLCTRTTSQVHDNHSYVLNATKLKRLFSTLTLSININLNSFVANESKILKNLKSKKSDIYTLFLLQQESNRTEHHGTIESNKCLFDVELKMCCMHYLVLL